MRVDRLLQQWCCYRMVFDRSISPCAALASARKYTILGIANTQIWFCNFLLLCYFGRMFTNEAKKAMSRLTIEVTEQQHQRIKALAALQGQSIKEYALQRLFPVTPAPDEAQAMQRCAAKCPSKV
jgi:hypothetical protein